MKSLKIIGFGILIWVVAFMVISVFIGFKVSTDSVAVKIITILSVFVATLLIAKNLKPSTQVKAITIGIIWGAVGFVLDVIITTRFTGMSVFSQWNILLGYLLIILTPLLAVKQEKGRRNK